MAAQNSTTSVEFAELPLIPGYRFGDDGSVWSRRKCCRWGQMSQEWRRVNPRKASSGHLKIRVARDRKDVSYFVHRLILEAFVGPCPPGMECCHYDGDPTNNRLDNLRWDTQKSNAADGVRHGVYGKNKGSKHHKAKITEADIPTIRRLGLEGLLHREIAERFGVTRASISFIIRGKTWKHV